MEKERKNILVGVLVGIIILLLGLCIYFLFFNNSKFNSDIQKNQTQSNNNVQNNTLPEWASYVLNQNIISITYEGYGSNAECIERNMTKDQLKDILERMTASNLKKYDIGGVGGGCPRGINIVYGNKELYINQGSWISVNDNDREVIVLLEKEKYTYEEPKDSNPDIVYYYDWDNSYMDNLFK